MKLATLILTTLLAAAAQQKSPDAILGAAIHLEEVQGDYQGAITAYKKFLAQYGSNRALAAKAEYHLGLCHEKLGNAEARKAYERVLSAYSDQKDVVAQARARLAAMKPSSVSTPDGAFSAVRLMEVGAYVLGPVSRDGRWLPWGDAEHGDLRLRDMKTGEIRNLTMDRTKWASYAGGTVISPDNSRVAFTLWEEGAGASLQVVNVDGSGRKTLLAREGSNRSVGPIGWLPDGKSIVVGSITLPGPVVKVGVVNTGTGEASWHEPVNLIPSRGDGAANLSADGRYVLVQGAAPAATRENQDVFVYDMVQRKLSHLVDHPANDTSPVWSADGRAVFFVSNRRGSNDVYYLALKDGVADGEPKLVRSSANTVSLRGTTADGTLIVTETSRSVDLLSVSYDPASGKVSGKPARLDTRGAGNNTYPAWSPDGRTLAFLRTRQNAAPLVVLRDVSSREEKEFAPAFAAQHLSWHPDGRKLLLAGANQDGFAVLDSASGQTTKLDVPLDGAQPQLFFVGAKFSPDGSELVFGTQRGNEYGLIAASPDTRRVRVLAGYSATTGYGVFAFSPDGKWRLDFEGKPVGNFKTLSITPLQGGEARQLVHGQGYWLGPAVFTPDSKHVIVAGTFEMLGDRKPGLWRVAVEGGKPEKILEYDLIGARPTIHPSGKEIVFNAGWPTTSLWAFSNAAPDAK